MREIAVRIHYRSLILKLLERGVLEINFGYCRTGLNRGAGIESSRAAVEMSAVGQEIFTKHTAVIAYLC